MRLNPKLIQIISLTGAILSWIALVFIGLEETLLRNLEGGLGHSDSPPYRIILFIFLLTATVYLEGVYRRVERMDVIVLLWRLFITGMLGIGLTLLSILGFILTRNMTIERYLVPIFFSVSLMALVVYFLSATFIFRRFILYQRTRRKLQAWYGFMGLLILALLEMLTSMPLTTPVYLVMYGLFFVLTLYLASQVRWAIYLNFNQKLRTLGLFALNLIVIVTYIFVIDRFLLENRPISLSNPNFFIFLIIFSIIYALFSMLVLFFNLPTSSVFEINSLEIASFSKINQAIQSNLDYTDIIDSMLSASMLASNAKGGWVEMQSDEQEGPEIRLCKRITPKEIREIKQGYNLTQKVLNDRKHFLVKNTRKHKAFRISQSKMRTLLAVPILSSNRTYGALFVVSDLVNSFEDVSIRTLTTFAEQAGIALQNASLVRNSIEVERYQEQLKIAKEMQNQLLPSELPFTEQLEIVAMSEASDEIGGDYFDVSQKGDTYKIAVGDVSGKGTTAAFYMAEVKGIFHALTPLDLDVPTFICTANQALAACMQKGIFMTLSYLHVNTDTQTVEMIRAGHCPAFFYQARTQQLIKMQEGTPGLGIIRNGSFKKYLSQTQTLSYEAGDFLVLYTDGIVEARDESGEEFGYERLAQMIDKYKGGETRKLAQGIVSAAKDFSQSKLQDDYTVMVIKFLDNP